MHHTGMAMRHDISCNMLRILIYCFKKSDQDQLKIAECFGKKTPRVINKNDQYIQTKTLCNHVIAAYYNGYKNIFAFVLD